MAFWELTQAVLRFFWLIASPTSGAKKNTFAEGLHVWERRPVPHLHYTMWSAYCWGKTSVKVAEYYRIFVAPYWLPSDRPTGQVFISVFRKGLLSELGRHKCFTICRNKEIPASANFRTKFSVSDCLQAVCENAIFKSLLTYFLPTYEGTFVGMRRHLGCKKWSLLLQLRAADLQTGYA
jgi:hypothetical protein